MSKAEDNTGGGVLDSTSLPKRAIKGILKKAQVECPGDEDENELFVMKMSRYKVR